MCLNAGRLVRLNAYMRRLVRERIHHGHIVYRHVLRFVSVSEVGVLLDVVRRRVKASLLKPTLREALSMLLIKLMTLAELYLLLMLIARTVWLHVVIR